jgi:restriction system protein
MASGPKFIRFFWPILKALRDLGGSAQPRELGYPERVRRRRACDGCPVNRSALSPPGFENLCKRLLTELGLTQLRTVGQAGDRGIDVEGHLRVNPVVSFRVGVQCKRYADGNQITPRQVRELQGALGPFDRGIFITTSVFTQQAEDQAGAPGYKPMDLIDGERLVELLVERRLGIKEVTVVDHDFFTPFQ